MPRNYVLAALFLMFVNHSSLNSAYAETKEIKVGVILPLSGEVAPMGQAFRRGLELFEKDFPKSPLHLVIDDHRYDGKATVSALHKLKDFDKVALQVVWGNMPGDTVAPIAEHERIPLIAISMNPVGKDRNYVISMGPPTDKLLTKVAEQLTEWQIKNAAAISIDIGNALDALNMLKTKMNGALDIKPIANNETDFKTLISSLKSKKVDGLFLMTLPAQALTFLRQAKQMKFAPKIIGGDVFADTEFQKEASKYTDSLYFVYGAAEDGFVKRLSAEFKDTSYFFEAATGYSLGMVLQQAAQQSSTNSAEDFFKSLRAVNTTGTPLRGLTLSRSPEYGLHFETEGSIYRAEG
jgi:branched-chain amino acid transport system substrate-binding protein